MWYFLRQTQKNMMESWGLVLQSLTMMSVAFLILGSAAIFALQIEVLLSRWEKEAPILVYLKETLTAPELQKLKTFMTTFPEIQNVNLISSKGAMTRLRQMLGDRKSVLNQVEETLLPPSFEVDLRNYARNSNFIEQLRRRLELMDGVKEVDVGREWMAALWEAIRWIRRLFLGGSGILLIATSFMAAGTIRLTFFMHHHEIQIMRLVGATERFIRLPFYLEGICEGACSAIMALIVLFGFSALFEAFCGDAYVAFTSQPIRFFSISQCFLFFFIGCIVGGLGSWIALLVEPAENKGSA